MADARARRRLNGGGTSLSATERLTLQQLRLREWIGRSTGSAEAEESRRLEPEGPEVAILPQVWEMTRSLDLHPWQESACDAWFRGDRRGTIKVVTGAGKTVVALAIIERLQRHDPELRVAIVVPTIVLMNQWYDVMRGHSNLPEHALGRLGGGHSDTFGDVTRVLIAVLASARKELPRVVDEDSGRHLLLVGDECHRVGAPEMSRVLQTRRAYSLGLSATPERADDGDDKATGAPVERARDGFGPIAYEMSFAQALDLDVLPPFGIDHFGLPLTTSEQHQYAMLSTSITDTRRELLNSSTTARNKGGGEPLLAWARRIASRSGDLAGVASRFVNDMTRRKHLLYRAQSRRDATLALVRETLETRSGARVILFHESIDEVIRLFELLESEGVPAVMEHSQLPAELRDTSLELFRSGVAQVVVSARSLIEGFNVPEADLGVIVASSSSPRQRIQSIGRVLRRHRGSEGDEKTSRICVLYIRDTVDEAIYERQNWDKLIGLDRNRYLAWDPPAEAVERDGPPRTAIPAERDIDVTVLALGDVWPGRYDGEEFSSDALGNVSTLDGRIAVNPQDAPERIRKLKGRPGRFKVTPQQQVILVRSQGEDRAWITQFGGRLEERFDFVAAQASDRVDVSASHPGDHYAGPLEPAERLRFRKRRGGLIAKPRRGGESFASGDRAQRLVKILWELNRAHGPVSTFFVNELGHAFWREKGEARFITDDAGGLFPDDEHSS